ncbi:MAG TPA: isochorismatase family protein [Syntrophorhabdaceae bacterium]|mgnify:FL=1|jgi:isochorismate hydrolase|nr:isochorismatase family protein [Syntrophorhabdaceae bacterium]MDI9561746.1 isochorismatase family protein [Pseudomonadota bacterium]OQC51167.1 MAG: Vibriobactin-specific isochorismatase [Deltaproteobacteria bacterium ADurb.Bin026]MBP8699133.1 isochorismatase family protein [Syntrophorhabdaceae bacterium]HOS60673.1 isochorismatase family protein [Syntrophorhabdaceae bacterium]
MCGIPRNTYDLITGNDCVLLVIDVQERLIPVISEKEKIVENVIRLLKFAKIVDIPVVLTEQIKLGNTILDVQKEASDTKAIGKVHFNCFFCDEFVDKIRQIDRKTLVIAGVESHICVAQTAIYALPDFNVHIISDAVSSRTSKNRHIALERMKQAGAVISSTEMFIYEILQKAGTDAFKATLQLVK